MKPETTIDYAAAIKSSKDLKETVEVMLRYLNRLNEDLATVQTDLKNAKGWAESDEADKEMHIANYEDTIRGYIHGGDIRVDGVVFKGKVTRCFNLKMLLDLVAEQSENANRSCNALSKSVR